MGCLCFTSTNSTLLIERSKNHWPNLTAFLISDSGRYHFLWWPPLPNLGCGKVNLEWDPFVPICNGTYANSCGLSGVSQIWHWSPALPYGSPNLQHRMDFWSLRFSLKFSPFFSQNNIVNSNYFFYSLYGFLGHFCTYLVTDKDQFIITMMKAILIVCTSCKTSHNVLSHAH